MRRPATPHTQIIRSPTMHTIFLFATDSSMMSINPRERKCQLIRHGRILERNSPSHTRTWDINRLRRAWQDTMDKQTWQRQRSATNTVQITLIKFYNYQTQMPQIKPPSWHSLTNMAILSRWLLWMLASMSKISIGWILCSRMLLGSLWIRISRTIW